MKRLTCCLIFFGLLISAHSPSASAEPGGTFSTKYTKIHYPDEKDLNDFFWRIGGGKADFPRNSSLAQNRIDRIVERVETILDMWPRPFSVNIYLRRGLLEAGRAAFYDRRTKTIQISVDYSSDGVFAHEVGHAVISQYFSHPPPDKAQEILTQYVDKYLWNDY
jgi:hypothetical protein